jgi:hypothetical protein
MAAMLDAQGTLFSDNSGILPLLSAHFTAVMRNSGKPAQLAETAQDFRPQKPT